MADFGDDVFLSYSHDSDNHKARVLALAVDLITKGIRTGLDQYNQFPAEGWPAWTARRIAKARFVLVICTKPYCERAMGEEKPGVGRGAIWESQVVTQELYENAGRNSKFIPVIFDDEDRQFVPSFLKPYTIFSVSVDKEYVDLLRLITDQPEHIPPPLGQRIVLPPRTDGSSFPERPAASPTLREEKPEVKGPVAFISHSHADVEMARSLDRLLRARGIGVWLDEQQLLPGRNLVDEIVDTGISKSDAFIVLLSENSVKSEWVKLELSKAVLQTVRGVAKLIIPVLLDDVEVPADLSEFVWERVDAGDLARSADRIAASIFRRQAPSEPARTAHPGGPAHGLPGLTADDERILVEACRQVLESSTYNPVVSFRLLFSYGQQRGMSEEEVGESLAVLEQGGYFRQVIHGLGNRYPTAGIISHFGLEHYLENYLSTEYRRAKLGIVKAIVNENARSSMMMALSLSIHPAIVEHVLTSLEDRDYVVAAHHMQGISVQPKPPLSRLLNEMES